MGATRSPRLARAGLLAAGIVAALALAEGGARVLRAARSTHDLRGLHELRPDRPWLYGLRPGAHGRIAQTGGVLYEINADGFRGPRHARTKPAGTRRVVVLGDSIAFGYGVDETSAFPRVLEAALNDRAAARVEVVNLGVGGYNAWNEAALLKDVGVAYEPDVLLAQFCINDLDDPSLQFDAQTRMRLGTIPDAAFPDPARRRVPLLAPSPFVAACAASSVCSLAYDGWLAWQTPALDARDEKTSPVENPDSPEWRWLESRYVEMAGAAAHTGARFAVLAVPYPAQLDRSGRGPVAANLEAIASRNGFLLIDPLPAYRNAHERGKSLFLDPWHPTPLGHRLAAEAIVQALGCGPGGHPCAVD